jgi:hypothetical protein
VLFPCASTNCKPSSFALTKTAFSVDAGQCYSFVPSGQVVTYVTSTTSDNAQTWWTTELTADSQLTAWGLPFNGYNFAEATSTSNGSSSSDGTSSKDSGTGLNGGAKAGIGVGVGLGTLGLLALLGAVLLYLKAKRNRASDPPYAAVSPPNEGGYDFRSSQPGLPRSNGTREAYGNGARGPVEMSTA